MTKKKPKPKRKSRPRHEHAFGVVEVIGTYELLRCLCGRKDWRTIDAAQDEDGHTLTAGGGVDV